MQQKLCSRGSGSSLLPERSSGGGGGAAASSCGHNAAATSSSSSSSSSLLPFRCPRCGEQERFRSLSSLRAHLEHRHPYASHAPPPVPPADSPSPPPPPTRTFSITGQIHGSAGQTHGSAVGLGQTHSITGQTHSITGQTHGSAVGLGQTHSITGQTHSITGQTHSITGQTHSITGQQIHSSVLAVPWGELSLPRRRGCGGGGGGGRGLHVRSLSDCREGGGASSSSGGGLHRASASARCSERRRTQSVGVGTAQDEEEEEEGVEEDEEEEERDQGRYDHHRHSLNFGPPPSDPAPGRPDRPPEAVGGHILYPGGLEGAGSASSAAAAGRRLAVAALRSSADTTPMQRRLASVSTELARADTQLLCQRAHWRHLARERQEVAERERELSRQVDVAVMVIAALREQLNASENELERREREVLTIQKFLEAAARQESCGKVRIQRFIENLLKRIALAERLLQYYQDYASPKGTASPPPQYNHCCKQPTDNRPHRTIKSRSTAAAGGPFSSSSGLRDNRSHAPSQFGGCAPFSKPPARDRGEERREREREEDEEEERSYRQRLAQSSRLFCRPEHRDDIWNPQHQRSATGYEA